MPEAAEKRECDSVPETAVFSTSISSRSASKPSCGGRVPFNPLISFQLIFISPLESAVFISCNLEPWRLGRDRFELREMFGRYSYSHTDPRGVRSSRRRCL